MSFDIARFEKVVSLMRDGATPGERSAARAAAERMAEAANLTFVQAVSKLDARRKAKPKRETYEEAMERQHPGWTARQEEQSRAKARQEAEWREAIINRYGSLEAVFAPAAVEAAISKAATPFVTRKFVVDGCGTRRLQTETLCGRSVGPFLANVSRECAAAISAAWPIPPSLAGVLAEYTRWEMLSQDRDTCIGERRLTRSLELQLRCEILDDIISTRPAAGWDDVDARFAWALINVYGAPIERLREDVKNLRAKCEAAQAEAATNAAEGKAHDGHRSTADKRRDVLSVLDTEPGLPDREVARRCGVSPSTVGNLRKQRFEAEAV